jgi:hypothetical protein
MDSLVGRLNAELNEGYLRAVAMDSTDADHWLALIELSHLHRVSMPPALDGKMRCRECQGGDHSREWPCQTLRLLADGLGVL